GSRGEYKFIHDRVQEAAYTMMSLEKQQEVHWKIANNLVLTWPPEKVRDGIFYVVNHWNAGAAKVSSARERELGADLNMLAARRAKDSSVYDLALGYAANGLNHLTAEMSESHHRVIKPLLMMRASCEFAVGRNEESEKTFQKLLALTTEKF